VQVGDGQFALKDLSVYESELPPAEVSALLVRNGFLSAYFRQFDTANEGNRPKNSLIFIVLFTDAAGAQTTLSELTDARLRGGYYEMSLGGTIGERSRGMTADFTGSGTTGPVSVADVLFTQSNALLVARTMDDIGTVSPQDAIQFAKAELAWLRR
jgi:hypothetical protein